MTSARRRVAITGLGIISCLGLDKKTVQTSLQQGKSGVRFLPERKNLGFQSALSGVIEGFVQEKVLNKKSRKSLPEFGLWAWDAILQALDQAGIKKESLKGDADAGIIFGNDSSTVTAIEQVETLRRTGETKSIGSGHIFRLLTSTITLNISTVLGMQGMSWTVSSACASGAMAVGQAAELIAAGKQKRMICGGAQEISWQSMCSFDTLGAFSRRENEPAKASRPFDRARDGLVPSGGAAAIILEEYQAARDRGVPVLGEVLGYACTSDGHHIVVPSGDGLQRAMQGAIKNAGLSPDDIDLVLAHATSTPTGDQAEATAIRNVFKIKEQQTGPWITAVKGLTGHEFWMVGASQVVYSLLMGQGNFIAGMPNLINPDPEAKFLRFARKTITFNPSHILLNASGFGGTNACLVIKIVNEG